ncbi:DUF397 domain-containing protein [Actinoallomurus purpureus]
MATAPSVGRWRKSSLSSPNGGNCVEVAVSTSHKTDR